MLQFGLSDASRPGYRVLGHIVALLALGCGNSSGSDTSVGMPDGGEGGEAPAGISTGETSTGRAGGGSSASSTSDSNSNTGIGGGSSQATASDTSTTETSGEPPVEIQAPELVAIEPDEAIPGEEVAAIGVHFRPNPVVVLRGIELAPDHPSDTELSFRVPEDFAVANCEESLEVSVRNINGRSKPLRLTLKRPQPTVGAWPDLWVAGSSVRLEGKELDGATVTLDDRELSTSMSSATGVTFEIPLDASQGAQTLEVSTDCGHVLESITVLPPAPIVTGWEPETVAPGGVLTVYFDNDFAGTVQGALIGGRELAETDPAQMRWEPDRAGGVVALRAPEELEAGVVPLQLVGASGASPVVEVPIQALPVADFPPVPPMIEFTPRPSDLSPEVHDEYPLPSYTIFPHAYDYHWWYELGGVADEVYGECQSTGTISGYENLLYEEAYETGAGWGNERKSIHPLKGTYRLEEDHNEMTLTIDRRPQGAVDDTAIETYVGGWTSDVDPSVPQTYGDTTDLVLTSTSTGRQLRIHHGLGALSQCQ